MKKILILMSTYNGEKYVREQVLSIIEQIDINVKMLIRDDGSVDETVKIIREFNNENIDLVLGENIGVVNSYLQLLTMAAERADEYDYFAFADQDDIWLPDKLISAIHILGREQSDLYCGSLDAFEGGNLTSHYTFINRELFSDTELMLRNSVPGCTMVFNSKLLFRICEYTPKCIEMYDSWVLRVCKYTGLKVVTDSTPKIRYRLHDNNTCGAAISFRSKLLYHFKNVLKKRQSASVTAHELLEGYRQYLADDIRVYLEVLDRERAEKYRKIKLIKYGIKSEFSTFSRRIDFMFEIITNKI